MKVVQGGQIFSPEWIHAAATKNAPYVACTVMCIALYFHLTSQMLLFSMILADCGAIFVLLRKYRHHQTAAQQIGAIDDTQPFDFMEATDEALAIERFKRSFKPFVAFCLGCMLFEFVFAVVYPSSQLKVLYFLAFHMVNLLFRLYWVDYDDQERVRWLFGWLWVGCVVVIAILSVFVRAPRANIDRFGFMLLALIWMARFIFANIIGIPSPCRLVALLTYALGFFYSVRIGRTVNDLSFSTALIVGGTLLGEIVGRLWVRRGRLNTYEELVANKRFQVLLKPYLVCSTIFAVLELCLPIGRFYVLCVLIHLAMVASQWLLSAFTDLSRARWLFGWGWSIALTGTAAAIEFTQQQHTPRNRLDTAVSCYGTAMCCLTFIYFNLIGTPWLARWTMLCLLSVLQLAMSSFTVQVFWGGMILGEIVGRLCLELHGTRLSSLTRVWSLAFKDAVKEREYVTKHFEESYSTVTMCCAVLVVLSCVGAACFPHGGMPVLFPLAFWLVILSLRVHAKHAVPREDKASYFGFRVLIVFLLTNMARVVVHWTWSPAKVSPVLLIAVAVCSIILLGIFGKLLCIPESHRQAINFVTLASSIAVSPCSTFGTAAEIAVIVTITFIGELFTYTQDQIQRSSYQTNDSLRRKLHSAEAQVKHVRATFQNLSGVILVTLTTDMVSHLGADGDILGVTGYTTDEFLALDPICDFLSPKADRAEVASLLAAMLDPKQPFAEVNIPYVHKDGHTIWLRACHGSRAIGTTPDGKPKILAVLSDVTVNHNLCEMTKKRDIQQAIVGRVKMACLFLSHEIRNQLFPQSVVLEHMKQEESKWTDSIDMILGANVTVINILNRVLDLTKWESGEFPVDIKSFPIARLFKSIALYAKATGVTFHEGLEHVEPTWRVRADEHLLKQAVTNLVSNASKFSNDQPISVIVTFKPTNHKEGVIVVTVKDKGRGMTQEQLIKAMVPFGQIRNAGEARSGTGLELPLTKAMVELGHKGALTLASDGLDKGTTATMRVPVTWLDEHEPAPQLSDPLWWVAPHPGATADILVVDDVKMNRMMIVFAAKKLGLTFDEAIDGVEAVECLRNNTYSMVFMDFQMPEMTGDVATEQARANGYTLPIVMVSGNTFSLSEQAGLKRRGMTAFLGKMAVPGISHAMKKLKKMKMCSGSKRRGMTAFLGKMAVPGTSHAMKKLKKDENVCH